jgi:hypothetical protein
MNTRHTRILLYLMVVLVTLTFSLEGVRWVRAQTTELVASLETIQPGVSVRRSGTTDFLPIQRESLVGVGDSIRTDAKGSARITFFASGTDTTVLPASEFRIDDFKGTEDQFTLSLTVVAGQTTQRIAKLLDSGSSYTINSTGLELAVRGTEFAVRVEQSGRSALVVSTGMVATSGKVADAKATPAPVPAGFGVRGEKDKGLSDVVKATNFEQLDAALDGCEAVIGTLGDVVLNVRLGPGLKYPRVGQLPNKVRQRVIGMTESKEWYRVEYKGGFAWVFGPALGLDKLCPGLRQFPNDQKPEDRSLYTGLDPEFQAELNAFPQ